MKNMKMLFLASNPGNLGRVALDEELRKVKELLSQVSANNALELVYVPAARPDDWLNALNAQHFRVVHFSGHGTKGGALQHVGSDGRAQPVSIQALKATLQVLKGEICLVVFSACYSRQQAELIAEEIDCVIAMNNTVKDEVTITFINAFYRAFFSGQSVQNAFAQGQAALMLDESKGAQIPELLVRPGVDAAKVMLMKTLPQNNAFIVFSPKDKRYLEELHTHLEYYEQKKILSYWDKTKLVPGSKWQEETEQALASSSVAILLVSANFFASKPIIQEQFPPLLQAAERGKITILCVLLGAFSLVDTNLEQFTLVNSQPLNTMGQSKREEVWNRVVELIRNNSHKETL